MEQCQVCFTTLECTHKICLTCLADWYDFCTTLTCPTLILSFIIN